MRIPAYWSRRRRNPGPPPAPTPETPLEIFGADLETWVEADQGIVLNGETVSEWQRIAGNINVSQVEATRQPTFIANDDGRPCLEFGSNTNQTRLVSTTGGVPGTSPNYTVAGVYRLLSLSTGYWGALTVGATAGQNSSTIGFANSRQRWWGGDNFTTPVEATGTADQDRIWRSFVKTGTSNGSAAVILGWVDGVQKIGLTYGQNQIVPAGLVIGAYADADGYGPSNSRVHSFVVAKRTATEEEAQKLNTYLRWAADLPTWTPFNLGTKLRFWMVSGYGETDLEPGISQIVDISGVPAGDSSVRRLLQGTAGARPITGTLNGRTAIVFDGTDDNLQSPSGQTHATIWGTTQYEDYTVAQTAGTLKADSFGSPWNQASVWTDTTGYHNLSHTTSGVAAYTSRNGDIYTSYIPLASGVPFLAQVRYDSGTLRLRVNDSAEVTATGGSGNLSNLTGLMRIGRNYASVGYQGAIAERVVCNQTLTTEERTNLLTYLSTRWGVAV